MNILVRNVAGTEYTITPDCNSSIKDVKRHVQKISGIAAEDQLLLFRGQELRDSYTLGHYSITNDERIHLAGLLHAATEISQTNPPSKEIILPASAIDLEVLEDYLRSHVDQGAYQEDNLDADVEGVVVVNTYNVLTTEQLRAVLDRSRKASEEESNAIVEAYQAQLRQRNAGLAKGSTKYLHQARPWISVIDGQCKPAQDCNDSELDACDAGYGSDLEVYSDDRLQHDRSETAVDVQVRLSLASQAHATVARIDSMSSGCFISRRLFQDLRAPVDKSVQKQFACPRGDFETEGMVTLFIYFKDEHQRLRRREVKFNVPKEWQLKTVDLLVTLPMARKLGMDKVAYGIKEPGNILAAIERVYSPVVISKQEKKAKAAADKANAIKVQQNLDREAEWKQRRQKLCHTGKPSASRQNRTPAQP